MPDTDTVAVSTLRQFCFYHIGYRSPGPFLCTQRATSVTVNPGRGSSLESRCDEHEGLWHGTKRGEALREIPRSRISWIVTFPY